MTEKEFGELVAKRVAATDVRELMTQHFLERTEFAVMVPASTHVLKLSTPEVRAYADMVADRMTLMMSEMIMLEKLSVHDRETPDGIWQTIKHRYVFNVLPFEVSYRLIRWRLLRPVRWTVHKFEARAIYPDVDIMRDRVILQVVKGQFR